MILEKLNYFGSNKIHSPLFSLLECIISTNADLKVMGHQIPHSHNFHNINLLTTKAKPKFSFTS